MTMTTQPTHHPLVAAYLRDLELLLHGLAPTERGEVLLGVRDHFEEALDADPSEEQVRAAIAELGPAVDIADEAYAAGRAPGSTVVFAAPHPRWTSSRAAVWTVAVLIGLSLLAISFGMFTSPMHLLPVVLFVVPFFPLWVPAVVISLMTRAWTPREKVMLLAAFPGLPVAAGLLSMVVFHDLVLMVVSLAAMGGAWYLLIMLVRRALARATS